MVEGVGWDHEQQRSRASATDGSCLSRGGGLDGLDHGGNISLERGKLVQMADGFLGRDGAVPDLFSLRSGRLISVENRRICAAADFPVQLRLVLFSQG